MSYNGHKNWNHWNVSLWIGNDEGLYRRACHLMRFYSRNSAAHRLLEELGPDAKTPDGAPYTFTTVRAALRGTVVITIGAFIRDNALTIDVLPAYRNPSMPDMPRNWSCEIRKWREGKPFSTIVVPFSQGSAHKKPPTLAEVLDCMASDAASIRNARSFEDWASDLGYDADSRKALATFQACEKQASELEALLGSEAFHTLIYDVERL